MGADFVWRFVDDDGLINKCWEKGRGGFAEVTTGDAICLLLRGDPILERDWRKQCHFISF